MSETKVFESELKNGVKYEIHVAYGFSNRAELAVMVGGEMISIISVEKKLKSGNIQCKPLQNRVVLIPTSGKAIIQEEEDLPNLDDIVPGKTNPGKISEESE